MRLATDPLRPSVRGRALVETNRVPWNGLPKARKTNPSAERRIRCPGEGNDADMGCQVKHNAHLASLAALGRNASELRTSSG